MTDLVLNRRRLLTGLGIGTSGLLLSGCDALNGSEGFRSVLTGAERLTYGSQRAITDRNALAREFRPNERSPIFRANGTQNPDVPAYQAAAADNFANWQLVVDGLVAQPAAYGLNQLRAMPQRTQITRHDCVEGWSAIGQWTGVPLSLLLRLSGLSDRARFIVFHCADFYSGAPYYESVDLVDAFHPQTIIAHRLNDEPLPVANGAPLRLRVERQLGYKHAKYLQRIEAVASLDSVGQGNGGTWEDLAGYAWYAGI